MITNFFRAVVFLGMMLPAFALGQVPHTFSNGSVADADKINENFTDVSDKLTEIENQVDLLIDTSSRLVRVPGATAKSSAKRGAVTIVSKDGMQTMSISDSEESGGLARLDGGRLDLEADCSEDPYALTNAYQEHTQYPRLVIGITGDCYGDIFWNQDYSKYVQEFSQDITIFGLNQVAARIIPRPKLQACTGDFTDPTGGRAGLVSSFNGSLYLSFVDLTMGECDGVGVLYSRGAGGTLNNVSIEGHSDASGQVLLSVRHNATIYSGNVQLTGTAEETTGARVFNGGAIYSYGGMDISVTANALQMFGDGGFFSYGADISFEGVPAVVMANSRFANLQYVGNTNTSVKGGVLIFQNSNFRTTNLGLPAEAAEDLKVVNSYFQVESLITSATDQVFNCEGLSTLNLTADMNAFTEGSGCLNNFQWSDLIQKYCEANSAC